jgi:hypothetical protein
VDFEFARFNLEASDLAIRQTTARIQILKYPPLREEAKARFRGQIKAELRFGEFAETERENGLTHG